MDTEKKLSVINLGCVRQNTILFSALSFSLSTSQLLLIEGANGSGKSSLLKLLAGLATPDIGEINWCDQPLLNVQLHYWQHLHYIAHANGLKLGLSVCENLQLAAHLHQLSPSISYAEVLTSLQLHMHQHTQIRFLSAGQRRRVALAKLFLFPKLIWLLDEPLTALDQQTQTFFLNQLKLHLQQKGIAIISSHHSIQLEDAQTQRLVLC